MYCMLKPATLRAFSGGSIKLNFINFYRKNCDLKILFMMETLHESLSTIPKIIKK